jgi:hypothetical protein
MLLPRTILDICYSQWTLLERGILEADHSALTLFSSVVQALYFRSIPSAKSGYGLNDRVVEVRYPAEEKGFFL